MPHTNKFKPHPLKSEVRFMDFTYWMLRRALGGKPSESSICRMLNGIDPMPIELEDKIKKILQEHSQEF